MEPIPYTPPDRIRTSFRTFTFISQAGLALLLAACGWGPSAPRISAPSLEPTAPHQEPRPTTATAPRIPFRRPFGIGTSNCPAARLYPLFLQRCEFQPICAQDRVQHACREMVRMGGPQVIQPDCSGSYCAFYSILHETAQESQPEDIPDCKSLPYGTAILHIPCREVEK